MTTATTPQLDLRTVARGDQQREWALAILNGEDAPYAAYGLMGKAKEYAGRYIKSQGKVVTRIRERGIEVVFAPGVRGGRSTGFFYAPSLAAEGTLELAIERGCAFAKAERVRRREGPDGAATVP